MYRADRRPFGAFKILSVAVLLICSIALAPRVLADPASDTQHRSLVFTIPTLHPAPTHDYVFQPMLTIPFPPGVPADNAPPDEAAKKPDSLMSEATALVAASGDGQEKPTPTNAGGAPELDIPANLINIMLLGTDRRPDWGDWRTDTIIVVSINPVAQSVGMLSIPRDLWIEIPDFGVGRINTVDFIGEWKDAEGGGPGLLKRTIEHNIGIPINRYARVDLEGFIEIVDALGGVTVGVTCPINDAFIDEQLTGEEDLGVVDLSAGVHHLDGLTALRYARSRRNTVDFDRAERQQEVLRGLAEQHLNWDLLPKLPKLWRTLNDAVETDLTLPELIHLASIGLQVQDNHIKSRIIDWRTTDNWVTASGGQVLLPNPETLPQAVQEFLNPPQTDSRLEIEAARIELHNSSGVEGLGELAERQL
jgi:LCP family protein required for cell wall assembly